MTKKDIHYLRHLAEKRDKEEISEAEKNLLDNFIKHEYEKAEWNTMQMGSKEVISSAIYHNIKGLPKQKRSFRNYYKYAVAAAIVVVVFLGLLLRPKVAFEERMVTTSSVTDSVKLSDGTIVYLAANSAFKYPRKFNGKIRPVSLLRGNAFFKVAKDHAHPFIVSTTQMKTKVLGTSFHISLDKDKSSVTVITGKVRVYTSRQVVYLKPNEKAVFTRRGLEKQMVNDLSLYSWYKKDIQLNNVSLDKVFTLLNFKYGVSFTSQDKTVLGTRMTLYIKEGLSLQKILNQINYITNLKFRLHGNTIAMDN